jgi:TolA-binding protein
MERVHASGWRVGSASRRAGLAVALWALSACAGRNTGATADLQLAADAAAQRAALAEAGLAEAEARLDALDDKLAAVGLDGGLGSLADVAEEAARLRGRVEELTFELQALRGDFERWQQDVERRQLHAEARLASLEQLLGAQPPSLAAVMAPESPVSGTGGAATVTPRPAGTPAAAGAAGPGDGRVDGAAARLALARQRMVEGQQAAARAILEAALTAAPDDPLAPELRYRVAQTLYNEGSYRDAARAYQVVTDKHPRSEWAPWAMLRIGECFEGMGRADAALTFFEGVERNYPGSDAAREAAKRLR